MNLRIRLTRLPDINTDEEFEPLGLANYGRFSILRDGNFWLGDISSSHPADTLVGWYWALTREGGLLVSARGAGIDGERLFTHDRQTLARLVAELVGRGMLRKPDAIELVR